MLETNLMNKILVLKAFEKAKEKKKKKGIKKPSQTDLSEELSNYIDKIEAISLGERSFRDYYNEAKKLKDDEEDIRIKQISVINGLCKYLGFNDYQEFLLSIEDEREKTNLEKIRIVVKKNKITISIIGIVLASFFIYDFTTRQRLMVWQEDHYVEVKLDLQEYDINQLKAYKEERILNFKQITPDCNTDFFKEDGSENLWYGKSKDGELEYFTDLGLHPETGSTLKKITKHMIKTHICDTY